MASVGIVVDGKKVFARGGQTVLEACREAGIYIPTLCHDDQLEPIGSCWICLVEVLGYGLVASCASRVWPDMVVETDNEKIRSARKGMLERLLADHYGDCLAPCQAACPAGVDVQGYIALIKRGAFREAVELIRETLPLPGVIGRICPHPCEDACRRNLVDQPIAICSLKRFAADHSPPGGEKFIPPTPRSGFRVAVIGSGPAGLSAAYYLTRKGHEVTIFERFPKPGGMLRYGIPRYRLPEEVLDQEISAITGMGVAINTNLALGKDFSIKSLLGDGFRAVFLATGAHQSQRMNVAGEDLEGVLPGTDFLRVVASGEPVKLGSQVVVIGGGNTAIDAARTALRLGAKEVTILYRRSRDEMPATAWEIEEAEEEGVALYFLAAPVKVVGEKGKVTSLECVRMTLGDPDASGRPRPEPIPGSEFVLAVDSVIAAIGQRPDLSFLAEEVELREKRGNIVADPDTLLTGVPGVFAGGDCVTGAATAVQAIGAGGKAALAIDRYLKGEELLGGGEPFSIGKGQLSELNAEEFDQVERKSRIKITKVKPEKRRGDFQEIELGYAEELAKQETLRCLECGCKVAHDCALRELATDYEIPSIPTNRYRYYYPLDQSHPFIERDPNKCITCERCARICRDVEGIGALSITYRVGTAEGYGGPLQNTTCVSCGLCVASCPVGALVSRNGRPPTHEVKTICSYCGVGCGLYLGVYGGLIVDVRGDRDNPVNKGNLCVKGRFGYEYVNHPDRLTSPLIKKDGKFVEATWEEALDLVASKFASLKGDSVAVITSAKCTNEDNYVLQKLARAVMGTNNVDHCARLCHSPSVAGLATSFGSGAMTNSIGELAGAACIFAIGTNTTEAHPIIGLEIQKAARNGAKLIVTNPREIDLCRFAHLWLRHRPGSDVALLGGMMRVILDEGLADLSFIEERCENFEELRNSLESFDLERVEKLTGVPRGHIAEAARIYATHRPASLLYAMGITQHSHGTDNVLATSNLAMLTGNVGRPSSGVNPLRGQNNVQGACDMGCLPNVYPGYQQVASSAARSKFEAAWGCSLASEPGLTLTEIFQGAYDGKIKALYQMGENPVLSDPDAGHVVEALKRLEFFVVQDLFLTETAKYAHVVLPGASFAERDGTFTNTERRVQRVRQAIDPVGQARPDWWITCQLAKRLGGKGFDFESPSEIMEEIAKLTPSYGGISYSRLDNGGLQWPCPNPQHPGTPTLHLERFARPNGKGKFVSLEYRASLEEPDERYPLVLTTGRSLYHFHTGTLTRKVEGLNVLRGEELVEINPGDARALGIEDGERVRVVSRRGKVGARVRVTQSSPPGVVFMTFHFAESATNLLTNPGLDPLSKMAELKVCAVRVEKSAV